MGSFESARSQMLVNKLKKRGILDARVLAAMNRVPREIFVSAALQDTAYADHALPIEQGQTISQPYIVGLMTQALKLQGTEKVLEIGTGSGYQAAVLCELAQRVITIERHLELAELAAIRLAQLHYQNVLVVCQDGTLGWPDEAPYQRIIVTATGDHVPPALMDQLEEGGLLVMPVGGEDEQLLKVFRKHKGRLQEHNLCGVRFVKLIGEQGWPDD